MKISFLKLEIIKWLLQNGAKASVSSDYNPDPFPYPYKDAPEIARLLISKGAKMISNEGTPTPLETARERLRTLEDSASPWRDYPFYDELVNSIKSLIDIYGKLSMTFNFPFNSLESSTRIGDCTLHGPHHSA